MRSTFIYFLGISLDFECVMIKQLLKNSLINISKSRKQDLTFKNAKISFF